MKIWGRSIVASVLFAPALVFADVGSNDGIEEKVREYFPNAAVMTHIARCESRFRQFDSEGMPLGGGTGGNMVGVFQINAPVHAAYAEGLGMDIYTLEGNLAYAKLLYEEEGTKPWRSSSKCWDDPEEVARLQAMVTELTAQLSTLLAQKLAMNQL